MLEIMVNLVKKKNFSMILERFKFLSFFRTKLCLLFSIRCKIKTSYRRVRLAIFRLYSRSSRLNKWI